MMTEKKENKSAEDRQKEAEEKINLLIKQGLDPHVEAVKELVDNKIKEIHGSMATAESVKEIRDELKELKDKEEEISRKNTSDEVYDKGAHPYTKEYEGIVEKDHVKVNGKEVKTYGLGLIVARKFRAKAAAALHNQKNPHNPLSPQDIANEWGQKWLADAIDKDLSDGLNPGATAGGAIVPEIHNRELIELLRTMNVVRQSGARMINLDNGNMKLPRQTNSATAVYDGENDAVNESNQDFDQVTLDAKRLTAITAVSNSLLRTSDPGADSIVRDDLMRTVSNAEDVAFLRGAAGGDNPVGIRNLVPSTGGTGTNYFQNFDSHVITSTGATVSSIAADLGSLMVRVMTNDTPMNSPVWYMHSRTMVQLMTKTSVEEMFPFKDMIMMGELFGWPFFMSNQIPGNLIANGSEIYFGDASEILIGDLRMLEMEVFPGGTYNDSTGTIVSGISKDQTVFKITSSHDMDLRHTRSFAVLTGVNY